MNEWLIEIKNLPMLLYSLKTYDKWTKDNMKLMNHFELKWKLNTNLKSKHGNEKVNLNYKDCKSGNNGEYVFHFVDERSYTYKCIRGQLLVVDSHIRQVNQQYESTSEGDRLRIWKEEIRCNGHVFNKTRQLIIIKWIMPHQMNHAASNKQSGLRKYSPIKNV